MLQSEEDQNLKQDLNKTAIMHGLYPLINLSINMCHKGKELFQHT